MFKNKIIFFAFIFLLCSTAVFAQWDVTARDETKDKNLFKDKKMDAPIQAGSSVEMQADRVQYNAENSSAKAEGNVEIISGATILRADETVLDRSKQEAYAKGHVYLDSPQFQVDADSGKFNFNDQTGQFENARIYHDPIQLKGKVVSKESDDHMVMENGYMTTCDHDIPHWRMATRRMDIYAGDKAVARGIKVYIGQVPVMYFPKYTQDLKDKPWFTFFPGYKKDLGYFLLTRSRIKINDYLTTTLRIDAYERQGFAWGLENKYRVPNMGNGLLRTYFINERAIGNKHPWVEKTIPTVQNERYQLEWRHKWDVNDSTSAIWQYYRLSDAVILPKYFQKEFRRDPSADTYFLLTKALEHGTLSFRVDHRVNRFVQAIDRSPEVKYEVAGLELGDSGLYLKSTNSISNLVNRQASPTEDRRKTLRVDTDNEVSYPTRIAFVRFTPFVGGDETYYSRTIDVNRPTKVVRSTFKTGADFTTRFIKAFDLNRGLFGSNLKRFRHIIAPSVEYKYQHVPNFAASRLNQFDSAIDGLDQSHVISFSLENKIQAKRGKTTIDLIRYLATVDFTVKQKGVKGQLGPVKNIVEITPAEWIKMVSETTVDHRKGHLAESNFDFYFRQGNKYGFDIGDRFARGGDHQLVTQLAYVVNPKWRFKVYDRFKINSGNLKEEEYTVTRDLHEWECDLTLHNTHGAGTEFLMVFRLKAFPGQPFDLFGTSFHERKAGSQSSTELQSY